MDAIAFKLADYNLLTKQLEQLKRDYAELLLSHRDSQCELTESKNEVQRLSVELAAANQKLQSSNNEVEAKVRELSNEVRVLNKQNYDLCEENKCFEEKKMKYEKQLSDLRAKCEEFERNVARLEKEKEEIRKNKEEENSKVSAKNAKLERDLNFVMTAATDRFRSIGKRLSKLEQDVEIVKDNWWKSGCDAPHFQQEHENFGFGAETKCHEMPPIVEKTASSMPTTIESLIDLDSSDDDAHIPLPKGCKRKLSSSECCFKVADGDSFSRYGVNEQNDFNQESMSPSKKTLSALKPCAQKLDKWDYEADLLDDLQEDIELCMKGVCVLYRQHKLCTLRETNLAKYLTNGDANKELKKTLADLESDPRVADDCRRIALGYAKQLFDIYKNGKDPLIAPDIPSTIM